MAADPMKRPRSVVAGLFLAAVLPLSPMLAGCGSGDSRPGTADLSRAEFIRQANAICNEANEVLRKAMVEAFPADRKPDNETGIRFTREVWVPNLREQIRDLRELASPPADRQKIDLMLNRLDRATDRVEADPALASQGPFDGVTRDLTAYGVGPCGSP